MCGHNSHMGVAIWVWPYGCAFVNLPLPTPTAHSTSFLLDLARNLVCLGIEEQLVPIINTVEGECRIRVCSVEEEYNGLCSFYICASLVLIFSFLCFAVVLTLPTVSFGPVAPLCHANSFLSPLSISPLSHCYTLVSLLSDVEEEYQTLLARKDDKTSEYKDLEAELGGLIRQLETQQTHLDKLVAQEKDAKLALDTYPNRISVIEQKIVSSDQLISTPLIKEEVPHLC